uniref:Uncharacterized protein n=1 Tax=Opuntia streptacantha TaxID=393608 RepID=A0A7C9DA13_OPUST
MIEGKSHIRVFLSLCIFRLMQKLESHEVISSVYFKLFNMIFPNPPTPPQSISHSQKPYSNSKGKFFVFSSSYEFCKLYCNLNKNPPHKCQKWKRVSVTENYFKRLRLAKIIILD